MRVKSCAAMQLETIIDRIVEMRDNDEIICQSTQPGEPEGHICERSRKGQSR